MRMKRKTPRLAQFASATALADVEQEQGQELDYAYNINLFNQTIANIQQGLDEGELSEEEAEELETNAVADLQERLGEDLGDEDEDEDEDEEADYSDGTDLATFAAATDFGTALLELGQAEGYQSVEDLVVDLADHLGVEDEIVLGLITGELTVDDFEDPEMVAHSIAEGFTPTSQDEGVYNQFMSLAFQESETTESPEAAQYSRYLLQRDQELNSLTAEFQSLQTEQALRDEMADLEREARFGVDNGWLPPVAYSLMFGDFESDRERIAAFSQVCESNGVDMATELYAMQKQLELFQRCGPLVRFGRVVDEPLPEHEQEEVNAVNGQASVYAKSISRQVLNLGE